MRILDNTRLSDYERKWMSVIEGVFGDIKNKVLLRLICYYSEWFASDCSDGELPKKFVELKNTLLDWERIEVLGTFYNPAKGVFEYKLTNGDYVPMNTIFEYKLSDDELLKLFEIEFLSLVDKSWMREYKLTNLFK